MSKNKYIVTYTSGGGTIYDDGEWIVTKTAKRIVAEKIRDYMTGIFAMHKVGRKIRIGNGTRNPIKHEHTSGFVVYFEQAGIPYSFELSTGTT